MPYKAMALGHRSLRGRKTCRRQTVCITFFDNRSKYKFEISDFEVIDVVNFMYVILSSLVYLWRTVLGEGGKRGYTP